MFVFQKNNRLIYWPKYALSVLSSQAETQPDMCQTIFFQVSPRPWYTIVFNSKSALTCLFPGTELGSFSVEILLKQHYI